ncbi:hypothetical protein OH492_15025 [Vibrio chagasii]|nr:hypothetical protein [Vibrio chagasii]
MVEDYEFIQAVLNTFWFSVGVVIPTIILGLSLPRCCTKTWQPVLDVW